MASWHTLECNFTSAEATFQHNEFENYASKIIWNKKWKRRVKIRIWQYFASGIAIKINLNDFTLTRYFTLSIKTSVFSGFDAYIDVAYSGPFY